MIILGILLAAGAGTFSGLLIADNTAGGSSYIPQVLGHQLPAVSTLGAFCAGLGLAFLISFGIWMVVAGTREWRWRGRSDDPVDNFVPGQWRTP